MTQRATETAAAGKRPIADHGTLSRAKYHGCKCEPCRDYLANYQRTRYRKIGYGTWQPLVDAEPVRQHLLALNAAGLSYDVIAERAGMYTATVTGFVYDLGTKIKRKKRTRRETAKRLLAITADTVTPGMVNAVGTIRRIRALAANGWPMRGLASHIGVAQTTVWKITQQTEVYRHTSRAVADCYEALRNERPEDHGVPPWVAARTRQWAAEQQWPDPLWWEDMGRIDDPTFDPAAVERELNRDELGALRREEIEHLDSYGCTPEVIAERLDMALSTVRAIVQEIHTGQRRDRTTRKDAA
jgi:hypothetical protein